MDIKFWRYDLALTHPWLISSALDGRSLTEYPVVFLELKDSQGRRGLGESAPSARYHENANSVLAFLRKVEAKRLSFDDLPASLAYLEGVESGNYAAKAAVNLALLDGIAQQARQPVCEYLKVGFTENKHITSFSIGIDQPDIIRRKVHAAAPYPVLKLKMGGPHDKSNLAALRSVAPAKPVRVDANEGWPTKEEALANIEWLAADGHVQFVEQPMPTTTAEKDLIWLKQRSTLPLMADESYHFARDLEHCASWADAVNVKLVKTGGLTGARDALQAARAAGLKTMLGCMIESSLLITAAAHLAELTDYLDLDGNLLITNDPFVGASARNGAISFADAPERFGLRVTAQCSDPEPHSVTRST